MFENSAKKACLPRSDEGELSNALRNGFFWLKFNLNVLSRSVSNLLLMLPANRPGRHDTTPAPAAPAPEAEPDRVGRF